MCRLAEEIIHVLECNGSEGHRQTRHGLEFICTSAVRSGARKCILPLEIKGRDTEEAILESEAAASAAAAVMKEDGEYPLIITEDRWRSRREMMEARLLAHLEVFTQIYARNCEIKRMEKGEAADFLAKNHSYGDAACRYRYGIFLKRHTGHNRLSEAVSPGTLVAVATFSNARKWIKGGKTIRSYEWTRYASLPGIRISGGMGKVLKTFIQDIHPDDIMSYADLEWSEGEVYRTLGFSLEGQKEPVLFRIDAGWRRFPVRTGRADEPEMTEGEKYFRNFGSNKYRIKITDYE